MSWLWLQNKLLINDMHDFMNWLSITDIFHRWMKISLKSHMFPLHALLSTHYNSITLTYICVMPMWTNWVYFCWCRVTVIFHIRKSTHRCRCPTSDLLIACRNWYPDSMGRISVSHWWRKTTLKWLDREFGILKAYLLDTLFSIRFS